jgi:high-affinity K+ transport system ATPase subunit B
MTTKTSKSRSLWDAKIVRHAAWDAVLKLNPRTMMKNPVMFVVEVGSVITLALLFKDVHRTVCKLRRSHGRGTGKGSS